MADMDEVVDPPEGEFAISVSRTANGVMVDLSGAASFDVEFSSTLEADSWTVIATDVTSFEDTDGGAGRWRPGILPGCRQVDFLN